MPFHHSFPVALVWAVVAYVAYAADDAPHPKLVTADARADAEKLSALERPGNVFFRDGFESPESLNGCYTYWMDMKRDRDGNYWGNMLGPADDERVVLGRDKWYCLEHMIQANDPGMANGELAAWIDGKLYIHYTGFRWRTTPDVRLKRFGIGVYVHRATRDNTVWYDDVALSTGYIGPLD